MIPPATEKTIRRIRLMISLNSLWLRFTPATTLIVLIDQDEYKFQPTFPNSGIPSYYALKTQPDQSNLTSLAIATAVQRQSGARLIE